MDGSKNSGPQEMEEAEPMKKGMILYVTKGRQYMEELERIDFAGLRRTLDVQTLRLTSTEDEVAEACWRMVATGIQQVSCIGASVLPDQSKLELHGHPIRLVG
jgi:hypothetical protein